MRTFSMKFFKRKLAIDSFTNLVAENTQINGTVNFSGVIQIEGMVSGDVISPITVEGKPNEDCINVTETGMVSSDKMQATNIVIGGQVKSKTIWAEDTLRILDTAKIEDAVLYYRHLEIAPDAQIHNCQLKHLDRCSEGEIV